MRKIRLIFLLSALLGGFAFVQEVQAACPFGEREVCSNGKCICVRSDNEHEYIGLPPASNKNIDLGKTIEKGAQDTGKTIEKGAQDTGKTIERGAQDTGKTIERGAQDTGKTIERGAQDTGKEMNSGEQNNAPLTPVREYLRAKDIPPPGAGAYGLVVFHSKATSANRAKLMMVCKSFQAYFPRSETSGVPVTDQMITIWPLDDPNAEMAKADNCDFVLNHYDLNASESAINDARKQHATFDGEGPYLVGWSPSNARGLPDKLVLVIDMSADNDQAMIDHKFLFWKNKIVENPSLWRNGWTLDGVRIAIKDFSDEYGQGILDAIKLIGN
jgi:hypothetical protein